jgi:hypothetical protein
MTRRDVEARRVSYDADSSAELTERVARRRGLARLDEIKRWFDDYLMSALAGRINGELTVETWEAFDAIAGDEQVFTAPSGRRVWSKKVEVKGTPTVSLRVTFLEGLEQLEGRS